MSTKRKSAFAIYAEQDVSYIQRKKKLVVKFA